MRKALDHDYPTIDRLQGGWGWVVCGVLLLAGAVGFLYLASTNTGALATGGVVLFGVVFGLCAALCLREGLVGLQLQRERRDEGVYVDYPWDPSGTRSRLHADWITSLMMMAVLAAVAFGCTTAALRPVSGNTAALVVLAPIDLLVMIGLGKVLYRGVRRILFEDGRVRFETFPIPPGDELALRFEPPRRVRSGKGKLSFLLRFVEELEGQSDDRSRSTPCFAELELEQEVSYLLPEMEITFAIPKAFERRTNRITPAPTPPDKPPNRPRYWELEVRGWGYQGLFPLPVYGA